jgi:hypothetical protein
MKNTAAALWLLLLGIQLSCAVPPSTIGALCALQATAPSCGELPALAHAPVIDGEIECGLSERRDAMEWSLKTPQPNDFSVAWATAYFESGFYFYVDVVKPSVFVTADYKTTPWCGDAVHLFVDGDGRFDAPGAYDAADTRQIICTAPLDVAERSSECMIFNKAAIEGAEVAKRFSSVQLTSFRTTTSYRFEGFLTAKELGLSSLALRAGAPVGYSLSVDNGGIFQTPFDPKCRGRNGESILKLASGAALLAARTPHLNTAAFCTPVLAPPARLNWVPQRGP